MNMATLVTWECLLEYKCLETNKNCLTHNQNSLLYIRLTMKNLIGREHSINLQ